MKRNEITEYQKEFLLDLFFRNEDYAGWRNIAKALIETGYCVVPGNDCIWKGGIGNFIKVEEDNNFIGCCKYVFDLDHFLSSAWYKDIRDQYATILSKELEEIKTKYKDIANLSN